MSLRICFAFCLILAGSRYTVKSHRNLYDKTPGSIENILKTTRARINYELLDYNFNDSDVHELKDLVMEMGGQPIRNIIISTWRSGSSFLGDIVNAISGNFYHYEPFLFHGDAIIREFPQAKKALKVENALGIIKNMLKCNFDNIEDYFTNGKSQIWHNTRLWDHCQHRKELCSDADFRARFCKLFPFQTMKVLRLRLEFVKKLLEDKKLNVKMVLLIRDPRAVIQSRQHTKIQPGLWDYWLPDILCRDMISDYEAAIRVLQNFPNRLLVVRFEELVSNLKINVRNLLKFLRLSYVPAIDKFLQSHTKTSHKDPYSTFRVTREVPFRWKKTLDFHSVKTIQLACKEAMQLWGYKMAYNATHMRSEQFYPLEEHFTI